LGACGRWRLPAGWLTPRGLFLAVGARYRPGVARRTRWWTVSGWLAEAAARSFRLAERWRRPTRWGGAFVVLRFLRGRSRAGIWCDVVDRRPRRHRRLGGRGRVGLRCRRFEVSIFGARPAEFSPQCVVAVGHCISPPRSDDADVGPSQVSTTPGLVHRIPRPGCAATVQQIPIAVNDVQIRLPKSRR